MPILVTKKGKRIIIPIKDSKIAKEAIRRLIERHREVFDKLAE